MSFYIGQKVVCINNKTGTNPSAVYPKLFKGATYEIKGLMNCAGCGMLHFNVGIRADISSMVDPAWVCDACGFFERTANNIHWVEHWRFVPLEDYEAMNELVKELTEPKLQEA